MTQIRVLEIEKHLGTALVCIHRALGEAAELAHDGYYDDLYDIAEELRRVHDSALRGRLTPAKS